MNQSRAPSLIRLFKIFSPKSFPSDHFARVLLPPGAHFLSSPFSRPYGDALHEPRSPHGGGGAPHGRRDEVRTFARVAMGQAANPCALFLLNETNAVE